MASSSGDLQDRSFKLGVYFKPTSPINKESLFAGRLMQTRDVVDTINQQGQHAVLYGERGVGKTSLANMIFPKLRVAGADKIAPQVNCMTDDRYADIWKRVFEEIQFIADRNDVVLGAGAEDMLREYTGPLASTISPDEVRKLLWDLGQNLLVVVILDEFDTLRDEPTRAMMSDTLKFLSDRAVPATIVLIGVADDVEDLISNHHSLERCLRQILMPRMSRQELEEIVQNGLSSVEMTIDPQAISEISQLSKGLPHYAHLLGLHAGRAALDNKSLCVTQEHVQLAVKTAIQKTQASIQASYCKAITSSRKEALFPQVLLACAIAETDDLGWFYARNVRAPLEKILGKEHKIEAFARHLHGFCEDTRGPVLRKDDSPARPRFRFANPLVQPYTLMRGLADRMISEEDLKAMQDRRDMLF
ncbi:MAG: orc1/cdc6 family replication initiation protein [Pirellulales bacterium]|nr:orc1/cdc6 family replication initiation protein [Pirellulales bacterium]